MIALRSGIAQEGIKPESRLLHDLGIDGDDAADLLRDYAKAFQVDMTAFDFGTFFMSELRMLSGNVEWVPPLTVDDLCRYAPLKKFVYQRPPA